MLMAPLVCFFPPSLRFCNPICNPICFNPKQRAGDDPEGQASQSAGLPGKGDSSVCVLQYILSRKLSSVIVVVVVVVVCVDSAAKNGEVI